MNRDQKLTEIRERMRTGKATLLQERADLAWLLLDAERVTAGVRATLLLWACPLLPHCPGRTGGPWCGVCGLHAAVERVLQDANTFEDSVQDLLTRYQKSGEPAKRSVLLAEIRRRCHEEEAAMQKTAPPQEPEATLANQPAIDHRKLEAIRRCHIAPSWSRTLADRDLQYVFQYVEELERVLRGSRLPTLWATDGAFTASGARVKDHNDRIDAVLVKVAE